MPLCYSSWATPRARRLPLGLNALVLILIYVTWTFGAPLSAQEKIDVTKDPRYDALTWVQNAAEYSLLTQQTYRLALTQLQIGMQDPMWSADEVQLVAGDFHDKPPAIILDCDETILDNSAYNARNIVLNQPYTTETWNQWCQEGQADAVPGALEFVKRARGLGVKIFYITNRHDDVKAATIKNLKQLGFPANDSIVLTKNDDLNRDGDKLSRRARVARTHRIVLLIGDNMSDLCDGMSVPNTLRRNEVANEKISLLGTRWIMLPNPVYGSWQRALPEAEKALQLKQESDEEPQAETAEEQEPVKEQTTGRRKRKAS